jgi:uncharacterized protein
MNTTHAGALPVVAPKEGPATGARIARLVRRHPLVAFIVLAYAFSWWGWLVGAVSPASIPWLPYPILPYGPTIAAFVVLALTSGKTGVQALLQSIVQWRVGLRWYVVALLLPAALYLAAVYLNVRLGSPALSADQLFGRWYTLFLAFPVTILLEGGALEEPGWRGYALPRLLTRRSVLSATLIVGALHTGWHLPLYVTNPANLYYVPLVMAAAVLFTWLYRGTNGSVLLAILFHGSVNTFAAYFSPLFSEADAVRLSWLFTAMLCFAAVLVVAVTGRDLSRKQLRSPSPPPEVAFQAEPSV